MLRTRLLSISFDVAFDTPAVLKRYAKAYQPGPDAFAHWQFLTGTPRDIKAIATFFGLEYEEESGQFTHDLRTAVIAPDGTVFRVYRGNDWKPAEVVADLKAVLDGESTPRDRRTPRSPAGGSAPNLRAGRRRENVAGRGAPWPRSPNRRRFRRLEPHARFAPCHQVAGAIGANLAPVRPQTQGRTIWGENAADA